MRNARKFMDNPGHRFRPIIGFLKRYGLPGVMLAVIIGLSLLWFWPRRGLTGKYYDNRDRQGEPVFTLHDKTISLDAVSQRQDSFPQRHFSVSWDGWIMIDKDGEYGFATESDDGSFLVLDELTTVVDNGGFHVARKASGTIHLSKGLHSIQIHYFQGGGAYKLRVFWQEPGKAETAIPPFKLYPGPLPVRGLGILIRNLHILYPLSWALLIGVVVGRRIARERQNLSGLARQYAQNLALLLVTVVVFGLAAEGVMRVAVAIQERNKDTRLLLKESQETDFEGGARTYSLKGIVQESPYPDIVYELKPNLRGNFREVPLVTNSRGLRDSEYSYQKPENTFRIVGLGDSSLFGWGVRLEDTSLKVLERILNDQSSALRYEVINFATPGYNTAIEAEVFVKKCLKYDPDLVIMHFNTNDYDVPGFMKPPQSFATLKKSYFLNFLMSRFDLLWGHQQEEMLPFVFDRTVRLEEAERLDEDPAFPEEYRHLVGKKGFLRAIETLVEATASRNIALVVYVIKAYPGLDPAYTVEPFRESQLKLITELSREKGFYLLNMYAAYRQYLSDHPEADDKVFWVTREDSHPSAVAHQLEAETLYEFLVEKRLTTDD